MKINTKNVPMGAVFKGVISSKSIYLKTFSSIVDLLDPSTTWGTNYNETGIDVNDYEPMDVNFKQLLENKTVKDLI